MNARETLTEGMFGVTAVTCPVDSATSSSLPIGALSPDLLCQLLDELSFGNRVGKVLCL